MFDLGYGNITSKTKINSLFSPLRLRDHCPKDKDQTPIFHTRGAVEKILTFSPSLGRDGHIEEKF